MSRLIDADAFVRFLKDVVKKQKYENLKIDELLTVADVIDAVICDLDGTSLDGFKNAPTIEPERKTGKWIDDCECSVCHWINEDDGGDTLLTYYNYCPNCGAKNGGEQECKRQSSTATE